MKSTFSRCLAVTLALCMVIAAVPLSAMAFVSETHDVFSRTTSTIAPGVQQDIVFAYNKEGNQMAYYVATADVTRDDVSVYANYKDNQCAVFGMDKLTNQMAAAQAKHSDPSDPAHYIENYNVVAGVNADFYNMTTGQPSGAFVMEGVRVTGANNRPWFAMLSDGTPAIGYNNTDWATVADSVVEAVGGSQVLVWEGKDVTASASGSYNTDRHSRTCVGITADGKVVMMVLDGRQLPFSAGGSMHELAQIMLEAGCVSAINLDGGGSTTFAAKQEGENEITIVNRPSDGSERSISSSLMIVSTAAPSDVFDHTVLKASDDYVTPGSAVAVTATGVSTAGTAAAIPAGMTWEATNGTVTDGVFVSDGTIGDATVQTLVDGVVVGETAIHVVVPDTIVFDSESMTVPYGKTIEMSMTATYGLNEVTMKAGDVCFALENDEIGAVDGFAFTAAAEGVQVTTSAVTATLALDASVTASSVITLGKGSEVLYDFEDGDVSDFLLSYGSYNYVLPRSSVYSVTAQTGKVHSGNGAMALNIDYSNSLESGYMMTALAYMGDDLVLANATRLGMWMYMPEESKSSWIRYMVSPITGFDENGDPVLGGSITTTDVDTYKGAATGVISTFEESGWHYISIDLSAYQGVKLSGGYYMMQFYISDRDGAAFNYYFKNHKDLNGNFTFYVDDITVDYSSAVDDREAPVFDSVRYADPSMSDAAVFSKGTVPTSTSNVLSFGAVVHENTDKSNYTGLDESTAKAYIDGVEVPCSIAGGIMGVEDVALADGMHKIKFSICDKQGNAASVIREILVQANSGKSTVKLVPQDPTLDRIKLGSVYYADLVATDIEKVQSVTTTLDLDNMSVWQLDHMTAAAGFEASYTLQTDANIATITVTRTGVNTQTGEGVLVTLPIRTWELQMGYTYQSGTKKGSQAYTYAQFRSMKEFWPVAIVIDVEMGIVTFTDGTTDTFTGEGIDCDTEMWANYANMTSTSEGLAYYNSWDGGHIHDAYALEDKAATCTEDGYTGRTYCDACASVVEWGTTIKASGHSYDIVDDAVVCTNCGESIGERYTGFVETPNGRAYMAFGKLCTGWKLIDGDYYYFSSGTYLALTGERSDFVEGVVYEFAEDGHLLHGGWLTDENGTRYYTGFGCASGWVTIDGKDYYFGSNGYRYEGWRFTTGSYGDPPHWFDFGDDGALVGPLDSPGLVTLNGQTYYVRNGDSIRGLVLAEDGYYYYFGSSDYAAIKNRTYWVSNTNGLDLAQAYYTFDENGRIVLPESTTTTTTTSAAPTTTTTTVDEEQPTTTSAVSVLKNGIVEENGALYYYVDDVKTYAGLVLIDGDYYYINSSCKAITAQTYWVSKTNGLLEPMFYTFGADGKMVVPQVEEPVVKNGIVEENGALYYYVDDVKTYAGLVLIDGDYYYINSSCKAITAQTYWVSKTNGLLEPMFYTFGADGKMVVSQVEEPVVKNGIVEENGALYYYVDDVKTYAGLVLVDGDYYYINSSCKAITAQTYWVSKTNGLLEPMFYTFGADGKMIVPQVEEPVVKNGIVEENGALYYYVDDVKTYAGLVLIDGDYYYVNSSGKVITAQTYWVSKTNGLMDAMFYTFDADGKMVG